jgi:hypothetical protein
VGAVGQAARRRKVGAYGAFSTGWQCHGRRQYAACSLINRPLADFQTVVADTDSSGQAHASAWRASDLDPRALGEEAIQKAVSGRGPRAIEPGRFDVVLDPYASHDLLDMLNLHGIGGRLYQEGRSWMNGREGQQAMAPTVDLWDDPQAPARQELMRGAVPSADRDRKSGACASTIDERLACSIRTSPALARRAIASAGHLVLVR